MEGTDNLDLGDGESSEKPENKTSPDVSSDLWRREPKEPLVLAQVGEPSDKFKASQNARELTPKKTSIDISYGEDFDKKIANSDYEVLRIRDIPPNKVFRTGVDENGFYFMFADRQGNQQTDLLSPKPIPKGPKHYFADNVQRIEIIEFVDKARKQPKATEADANSLRAQAMESFIERKRLEPIYNMPQGTAAERRAKEEALKNARSSTYSSYSSIKEPQTIDEELKQIAARCQNLTAVTEALEELKPIVEDLIKSSKANQDNPYLRLYMADIYLGLALKPIINDLKSLPSVKDIIDLRDSSGRVDISKVGPTGDLIEQAFQKLGKPSSPEFKREIKPWLDAAIKQANAAMACANGHSGTIKHPSGLFTGDYRPFSPHSYLTNPDLYWTGAYDQAALRSMQLASLEKFLQLGAGKYLKLPPMPQRIENKRGR